MESLSVGMCSCTGSGGGSQSLQCKNASPIKANASSASSSDGSAAGLLFLERRLPIRTGDEVEIVKRVTGQGPFRSGILIRAEKRAPYFRAQRTFRLELRSTGDSGVQGFNLTCGAVGTFDCREQVQLPMPG